MKIIIKHIAVIFVISFLCSSCTSQNIDGNLRIESKPVALTNWQYYENNHVTPDSTNGNPPLNGWIQIDSPGDIKKIHNGNTIWLRTILPEWQGTSPALYIGQVDHFMQVYLNNKLIYQLGDSSIINKTSFIGWNQNLVELPHFRQGDIIAIRIVPLNNSIGLSKKVLLCSNGEIVKKIFIQNISGLFFGSIFLVTGLITFIIFLRIPRLKVLFGITSFVIPFAVFVFSNSLFVQLMYSAPSLYYHLDFLSLVASTAGGFFTITQIIISKYKKIVACIWQLHLFVLCFSFFSILFTKITYLDILPYFLALTSIDMLISIVLMVLSARIGNYDNKILIIGFSIFFIFAMLEIAIYFTYGLYTDFGYNIRVLHFGFFCYVISVIWIAINDYIKSDQQKEAARLKELEAIKRENEARQQFSAQLLESQENERNRIALGLHDSVGQKLLLIKNQLLTRIRKDTEAGFSIDSLKKISDLTGETIQEVRNISHNLRPQHLDQLGLTTAIETLVERVEDSSEIKFKLKIDNIDEMLLHQNEINFFRIVQESLNNIVKHSGASEAFINIETKDSMIFLEITDNGTSAKPSDNSVFKGLGIRGMYERAEMIGAKLNINFTETGTIIRMEHKLKH